MNVTYKNQVPKGYATTMVVDKKEKNKPLSSREQIVVETGMQMLRTSPYQVITLIRSVVRQAIKHKIEKVAFSVDQWATYQRVFTKEELVETIAREVALANYEFTTYKSESAAVVTDVVIVGNKEFKSKALLDRARAYATGINHGRDLSNTPGSEVTPASLATELKKLASKSKKCKCTVLSEAQCKKMGMGLFEAVGRGSDYESKFIVLEYAGGAKSQQPIVLIGKGVTFDTGGLNIKPTGSMEDMFLDMSGAASVVGAMDTIMQLGVKQNVVAVIPAVENAISGSAFRPGDILRSLSGKTVHVGNTDAEGRLILADALTYSKKFKPSLVIDVATLTGAALVALGMRSSALFSDSNQLLADSQSLGMNVANRTWPLPLWDEYAADMKSDFADISNISNVRWGGSSTAAIFLKQFVDFGDTCEWMHIDMAPRMESIEEDQLAKGATGEPTALLVKLVEEYRK